MTQPTNKRPALGRGLGALLPSAPQSPVQRGLITVSIDEVHPERRQPRRHFDQRALEDLAASIRAKGLIQPLLVRRQPEGGYVIVAGERRWRASREAGLSEVQVIVKEVSDVEAFEVALIENIQRQDLNPIEEADAYQRLVEEYGLTQEEISTRVGKERSTVANSLRLLRLPSEVKDRVAAGQLSPGHAKVLLGLGDEALIAQAAETIGERQLSVRDAEKLVQRLKEPQAPREKVPVPDALAGLAARATKTLRRPVELSMRGEERGSIVLRFESEEEAQALLGILLGAEGSDERRET